MSSPPSTNPPAPVEVLKELAKRYRARVSAANLRDPTVATSRFDWRDVFEHKPPPPDQFRHQVRLKVDRHRVVLRANDKYLVIEARHVGNMGAFSVNRPFHSFAPRLNERLPVSIGREKLHVYVPTNFTQMLAIDQPEVVRSIEEFALGPDESLHVHVDGLIVYVTPVSLQRAIDLLGRIGPLIGRLQQPGEEPVDFSDLPPEFVHLVPLMKSWAKSDDEERSTNLSRASNARLQRLVSKVAPHLDAIDKYLDGFGDGTVPESATVLGCLAECACEAQLLLTKRQANTPRSS
jgi:hypothetical protein